MSAQTQAAELLDQAAAHLLEHIDTLAADVAEACATWAAEPNIPSAFEAGVRGVACPKSRHRDVSRSRWRPTDSEALEGLDRTNATLHPGQNRSRSSVEGRWFRLFAHGTITRSVLST
jgi:hypothetical protein